MTQDTKPVPKKRRWLKRIGWTLLVLFVAGVILRLVGGVIAQQGLNVRLEALRAAGEPIRMTELAPPEVLPERNAAVLYNQAFAILDLLPENVRKRMSELGSKKEPLTAPEVEETRMLLAQAGDALKLIQEGTMRPGCRFPVKYDTEPAIGMLLPHLSRVRNAGRLLALSSEVNLADGKGDAAAGDCLAIFHLARSMHDEPTLISLLVQVAVVQIGCRQLEAILDRSELSAETLERFLPLLDAQDLRKQFARTMRGERCFGIDTFEWMLNHGEDAFSMMSGIQSMSAAPAAPVSQPVKQASGAPTSMVVLAQFGGPEPKAPGFVRGALFWIIRPFVVADMSTYIDIMNREVRLSEKPLIETKAEWEEIKKNIEGLGMAHAVSHCLLPALYRAQQMMEVGCVEEKCARTAIALRLYRIKYGVYPDCLGPLAPEFLPSIPRDPFSGAELIYRRDGQGFILYSVGINGKDDGGVPGPYAHSDQGDIVWQCSR